MLSWIFENKYENDFSSYNSEHRLKASGGLRVEGANESDKKKVFSMKEIYPNCVVYKLFSIQNLEFER